ncbi:SH3 domain-containing protein [Leptolyngbyaceae cyanobacterium JSC-12]|nr:SH3 domain-containing protein [Leptolyngbyaceae cyanobacterium JSC-12]
MGISAIVFAIQVCIDLDVLLGCGMMLKRSFPLFLTTIAFVAAVSPVLARGISTLKASNPNSRINVRSQPTIQSRSPSYGLPGDKVKVIQCVKDQDRRGSGLNWCKVQFVQSKVIGWIRSDFIIFADGGE